MKKYVLITGGCGYIGTHVAVELLQDGYNIVIVDNLSNSSYEVLSNVTSIIDKELKFEEGDVRDKKFLISIFKKYNISLVIHLSGLKSISESIAYPLEYYDNNIQGTLNLLKIMGNFNVKKLIFSSSATVYGPSANLPCRESSELVEPNNPYGYSKYCIERILDDLAKSDSEWSIVKFRYFNPVGAHKSGLIGEYPQSTATNLMPHILKAANREGVLEIFGNDFLTEDGTAIRDFIHVTDLAKGHCSGIYFCNNNSGSHAFNLGTGKGYSVMNIVESFKESTGIEVEYKISPRREGDSPASFANVERARSILGWTAKLNLNDMCKDSWKWSCFQKLNQK